MTITRNEGVTGVTGGGAQAGKSSSHSSGPCMFISLHHKSSPPPLQAPPGGTRTTPRAPPSTTRSGCPRCRWAPPSSTPRATRRVRRVLVLVRVGPEQLGGKGVQAWEWRVLGGTCCLPDGGWRRMRRSRWRVLGGGPRLGMLQRKMNAGQLSMAGRRPDRQAALPCMTPEQSAHAAPLLDTRTEEAIGNETHPIPHLPFTHAPPWLAGSSFTVRRTFRWYSSLSRVLRQVSSLDQVVSGDGTTYYFDGGCGWGVVKGGVGGCRTAWYEAREEGECGRGWQAQETVACAALQCTQSVVCWLGLAEAC